MAVEVSALDMAAELDDVAQVAADAADEEVLPEDAAEAEMGEAAIAPVAETAGQGKKRRATVLAGDDKERVARKPRWGEKAFEDITLADVETLVRKCNSFECEQNLEFGQKEVNQAKSAISKQLSAQMIYVSAFNAELKDAGREICAFVPNVGSALLKELGGDINQTKTKQCKVYFERAPFKSIQPEKSKTEKAKKPPGGNALVLGHTLTLKYFKTTSELMVKTSYKFGTLEQKGKPRGRKKKANGGDAANEDGGADGLADECDDVDGDDEEDEEEGVDDTSNQLMEVAIDGGA